MQRTSISPGDRTRSPESKKLKKEESDGERSDQDLVVDDANEGSNNAKTNGGTTTPAAATTNGNKSPKENGTDGAGSRKDPHSPASARSTPGSSSGKKEESGKPPRSSPGAKVSPPTTKPPAGPLGALGYPFPDGLAPPGVFNGFRPPLPGALDRPLPPGLIGGKP